ncbi:alpha/beta fold hydrolase [Nocardioides bizhenqiangii]|uniref:Alpha/beta fold hydrolase n=1 Tax=Nocardioides bizhenqiangii TaxID=3095076 RepID=A0ABZ0ZM13_9ACTN|nr:alpha/beta fold hydrolase [Nocardioides sp. HM61]WQQ24769.1 alpha/beta fold hydrolase [Nocardioides sp. HM61]
MRTEAAFATSADGTRIAWSRHGSGPALVRVGTWLTHLDFDWSSPVWSHWLEDLGQRFTVVRYDDRGCGLSDRAPTEYSLAAWMADLEAVVDAARLSSFTLLGMSQGGAVAVEYARAHPGRVTSLVLCGAYGQGALARSATEEEIEERDLRARMIKVGWGRANPVFRRVFTSSFIPGASETQMRWFDELQRRSMSAEAAFASSRARAMLDVTSSARAVSARTLVMHADGDQAVPFEQGRQLAGLIPGARFVPLHSQNHILLADEPAWPDFLAEVTAFVGVAERGGARAELTVREVEVLRLVAHGRSNEEIGSQLSLSTRTVERHLSNIYSKLELTGKSARAAAAARLPELEPGI